MGKIITKEIQMCNTTIHLDDYMEVRYTKGTQFKGRIIKGKVTHLCSIENDNHLQAQLNHGWCFHDNDEILVHKKEDHKH